MEHSGNLLPNYVRGLSFTRRVGYVQDVRYIAKEHMDVRRDPFNVAHRLKKTLCPISWVTSYPPYGAYIVPNIVGNDTAPYGTPVFGLVGNELRTQRGTCVWPRA